MYDKKGDKEKPEKPSTLNVHPQHKEEVVDNFKSPLQGELVKSFSKGKNSDGVQQAITPSENPSNETIYLCNFRVSVDGDWLCLKELEAGDLSNVNKETGTDAKTKKQAEIMTAPLLTPTFDKSIHYPNCPSSHKGRRTH